jgi:hypothetical protein
LEEIAPVHSWESRLAALCSAKVKELTVETARLRCVKLKENSTHEASLHGQQSVICMRRNRRTIDGTNTSSQEQRLCIQPHKKVMNQQIKNQI